jgi:hypothetical protein
MLSRMVASALTELQTARSKSQIFVSCRSME